MIPAGRPWALHLAQVMKLMRELRSMSLRAHAKELGLSPATLSRIEHGKGCDMETLMQINVRSGASVKTLLGLPETQESKL